MIKSKYPKIIFIFKMFSLTKRRFSTYVYCENKILHILNSVVFDLVALDWITRN